MNLIEIGLEIRNARKASGLTQHQVAQELGMAQATLSLLESGVIDEIGIRKVMRVMDWVGLALSAAPRGHGYTLEDAMRDRETETQTRRLR